MFRATTVGLVCFSAVEALQLAGDARGVVTDLLVKEGLEAAPAEIDFLGMGADDFHGMISQALGKQPSPEDSAAAAKIAADAMASNITNTSDATNASVVQLMSRVASEAIAVDTDEVDSVKAAENSVVASVIAAATAGMFANNPFDAVTSENTLEVGAAATEAVSIAEALSKATTTTQVNKVDLEFPYGSTVAPTDSTEASTTAAPATAQASTTRRIAAVPDEPTAAPAQATTPAFAVGATTTAAMSGAATGASEETTTLAGYVIGGTTNAATGAAAKSAGVTTTPPAAGATTTVNKAAQDATTSILGAGTTTTAAFTGTDAGEAETTILGTDAAVASTTAPLRVAGTTTPATLVDAAAAAAQAAAAAAEAAAAEADAAEAAATAAAAAAAASATAAPAAPAASTGSTGSTTALPMTIGTTVGGWAKAYTTTAPATAATAATTQASAVSAETAVDERSAVMDGGGVVSENLVIKMFAKAHAAWAGGAPKAHAAWARGAQ